MGAAGGREAALCSCLLSCWNSALSANPFNSRPTVFVWADVQAPKKWLDSVCAFAHVSGLVIEPSYCVRWLMQLLFGELPLKLHCAQILGAQNTRCTAFTPDILQVVQLILCLAGFLSKHFWVGCVSVCCVLPCADALISLFLLSLAKEEQCVPEVSGRAAAVGNSR